LRFSVRASCIARLQEKSPCVACFGRSMWISLGHLGRRNAAQRGTHQLGKVGFQVLAHQGASGRGFGQAVDYTLPGLGSDDSRRDAARFCVNSILCRPQGARQPCDFSASPKSSVLPAATVSTR
jgi:hypothetical protein